MNSKFIYAIGIMSGTSLDGIDLVYSKFNKEDYSDFEILESETYCYLDNWKSTLQKAIYFSNKKLAKLDSEYGILLGNITNQFILKYNIKNIDFIASHGHTILHQPKKGITLQIGNGKKIAEITQCKVICDFRSQDVKLGGQGAPLVPIGDELLFFKYDYCINLGGFANISYQEKGKRIAYDICPVNIVLNKYSEKIGFPFDNEGKFATQGNEITKLQEKLNSLEYYKKLHPKSLGLEWVQREIFPLIDAYNYNIKDVLRTYTDHAAWAISQSLKKNKSVLITGGGVYNSYLISKIKSYKEINIIIPDKNLIEFKEALIFSLLGLLRLENKINCLKSVTGALKNHSSGVIFMP